MTEQDKNKQYIRLIGYDWDQHTDKRAGQIHRVTGSESDVGWVRFEDESANIRSQYSTRYRAEYVPVSDPEHPDFRDSAPTFVVGDEWVRARVLVEKGETAPETVVLLADGTWLEVKEA